MEEVDVVDAAAVKIGSLALCAKSEMDDSGLQSPPQPPPRRMRTAESAQICLCKGVDLISCKSATVAMRTIIQSRTHTLETGSCQMGDTNNQEQEHCRSSKFKKLGLFLRIKMN
jgi:hypothetical protein